ncbi:MAG: hypothetical protein IKI15_09970 [Lachnospiraceae bacterium]|nr:hypothetical protein [Lachnospiraceae bacterium]
MGWHPEDPSYTIYFTGLKPDADKRALVRYIRGLFNLGISEAVNYVENQPDKPFGFMKTCRCTLPEAERIVRPIMDEGEKTNVQVFHGPV